MSQPQIASEPVEHLTFLPAPSTSPFKLPALLEFLSARIDPTLADLRTHDLSPPPFLTLIVGSPAHPLAGKALHSHLVGCYTNNDTRYHSTLFVPVGPDHCLPVPLEWAPLFVALATICLYPSLPFLVCTPDYTLGTFSDMDDLTACFPRPAALQAFSSHSSLVRPDVFLRLPPAANFAGKAVAGRPDFVSHTPAAAMSALLTTREATYQHCPSSRDSIETGSVNADLHFALYCTPYYGHTPESETDFIAMTFTLADFLVYTCFTTDSEPNAALSNLSVRPGDLLTILSTIHPIFLSVSPGDGLFILPLTTSKAALRPFRSHGFTRLPKMTAFPLCSLSPWRLPWDPALTSTSLAFFNKSQACEDAVKGTVFSCWRRTIGHQCSRHGGTVSPSPKTFEE